ncbi:MAG: phenylalanine--tRNA ligase subunit beta [Actinomycetota bacterium]|nr:phenylalanine--tRNA ligase subunit beta [Actinomycetota bacterium]
MRAALSWLAEWVALPTSLTVQQLSDTFVQLGFEVEDVHIPESTTGDLLVGKVLAIEELTEFAKPIRFCSVDLGAGNGANGSDRPRGIVCGATNFAVGDLVVVAPPGTVLPGGFAIAARQTYGQLSDGMICSGAELGTGTDHDGILVLGDGSDPDIPDALVGTDARSLIGAADPVFELDVLPDRGYAMSIRGLARELAAAFELPFADKAAMPSPVVDGGVDPAADPAYPVQIEDVEGCSRFVATRISGVDPAAASPYALRRRLTSAGIRSISLAVDVTNFVMLEYGQPLHAYDAATLTGPIVVRRATPGQTITTLDNAKRMLVGDEVLITDESGPIGLAGVMGGAATEISGATTDVLIEAATFNPQDISRTARRQRLPSEASKRFERGVDPQVAPAAADRAAALIAKYSGGTVEPGRTDVGAPAPPAAIELLLSEPERLAGRPYPVEAIVHRLQQIGAAVSPSAPAPGATSVQVVPPTWRPDLLRPADLVEEVARLESYDTIPSVLPAAPSGTGLTDRQRRARVVAADLTSAGLTETLSFPFIGTSDLDGIGLAADDIRRRMVRLTNPLDAGRPFLRTTLLPGLLDTTVRNLSRGVRELALYEIGQVFLPRFGAPLLVDLPVDRRPTDLERAVLDAGLPDQPRRIALVLAGELERAGWWGSGRRGDWADAIELGRRIGAVCGAAVQVVPIAHQPWHPGRCGELRIGDWPIGHAGELHPAVIDRLGLPARTAALELNLDTIPYPADRPAPSVSSFPPVHLDVALTVTDATKAADIAGALSAGGGRLLESVRLFDVYTGSQLASGHKSLAFALTVRAPDRTLTAAQAWKVRDAAVATAAARYGATVRI